MVKLIDAIFNAIVELLAGLFKLMSELIQLGIGAYGKKDGKLTASFGLTSDLLSRWNYGFCLNGTGSLTRRQSFEHVIVFSKSGGGKTSTIVVNSILKMTKKNCSMVVHDPSGELYDLTSGALAARGYLIKRLSFASNDGSSDQYNPMIRATKSADIRKLASMIVRHHTGGSPDPFWDNSAISLISVLLQILQTQDQKFQNLANCRYLLNLLGADPEKIDAFVSRCAANEVFEEYASLMAYDKKVISGIIASARAALDTWSDPDIMRLTCNDTLDLETLRMRPTILYVQSSTAQLHYYSLLTSMFFEQLLSVLMQRLPGTADLDTYLIVDEAACLSAAVSLSNALSNLRKYRVGCLLAYQDYNQLIHVYGRYDSETIRQNSLKIYFSDQSPETCAELERLLGKYEVRDEKGNLRVKNLLNADEIRMMPKDKCLIIASGLRPILSQLIPFYHQRRLLKLTRIPPFQRLEQSEKHFQRLSLDVEQGNEVHINEQEIA